jgi:hypothetical protein
MRPSLVKGFIISTFVSLYLVVSIISTIHVIDFFRLSNPNWLAVSLAIAFEIGAAASLASLIALDKMNKTLIWFLFILLTAMQMMGNTYYAFTNLQDYQSWIELFGLVDEEPIYQKRILSIISGAILPLVALGFIKSLVDYIKPSEELPASEVEEEPALEVAAVETAPLQKEAEKIWAKLEELKKEGKLPADPTPEELAEEPTALANSGYTEEYASDEDMETASLVDFENFIEEEASAQAQEELIVEEAPSVEEINRIEENQISDEPSDEKKKL